MKKFWRRMRRRRNIDFRKDPAPTDWMAKNARTYPHLDTDYKTDGDNEFITELNQKRCEPICSNGNGQLADSRHITNGQPPSGQPPVRCVCSLVERLADAEGGLVPVDEFLAVAETAGYDHEQAQEEYRHYATDRIGDKYEPEFERLCRELENAYNWGMEFAFTEFKDDEDDPEDKSYEIHREIEALLDQIDREVEAAMSA